MHHVTGLERPYDAVWLARIPDERRCPELKPDHRFTPRDFLWA